ncbi:disease resistance protein RPV1 isoform X3 [Rosa chinensis]|nr:disease resistance protein RPV1 isoform X3 [Rosa chinensis]
MGGIGKTTMVRAVYERISCEFQFSFLITDVRNSVEKSGLLNLQKQLLSGIGAKVADISDLHVGATILKRLLRHKKVLLILDDVSHSSHLEFLAGNPEWFGSGSRVLITTRDEHLLIEREVESRLKVEELNDHDSLQLFSWKAFKRGYPEEDFLDLSKSVINYAKGLPLALKVLGSLLCGRDPSEWNSALRKLGRVCNLEIFDILKISYDGLDSEEKKIFLDIACFFNWQDKVRVTEVLTSCYFSAPFGIKVLTERSLLTVSHGRLIMHDLLQEMGWEIVRQESHNELGRCSRLWLFEDVKHVLTKNTGTEAVEGIFVDSTESGVDMDVTPKSFSMMSKLRYLKIENGNLPRGLEYLPNSLRILDWTRYPSNSLPSHFNPQELLELSLCHSCIKHVRIGTEPLCNLKTINLSYSLNLVSTPNFKGIPYLKFLYLEGCIKLYEVDPTIEVLERLTVLNLKDCKSLMHFASSVRGLKNLKVLNLSGCSKLKKLPNDMGHLESLEKLHVNGTGIRELPSSIGMLERLPLLKIEDCKDLVCLPISLGGLKSLKVFIISGCSKVEKLPEELGDRKCLVEVDVSGTSIKELPCSIGLLEGLVSMSLRDCKHLECLPSSVGGLKSLKYLKLSGCSKLDKLPDELSHVACLENLDVSSSGIRELPSSIGMLEGLVSMSLTDCKNLVRLPSSVGGLKSLKDLNLSGCSKLDKLPDELGHVACLEKLDVSGSGIGELPSSIGMLEGLVSMSLRDCKHLECLPSSVGGLKSLKDLNLSGCSKLDKLPDELGFVACLEKLDVSGSGIRELPSSIGMLERLTVLNLKDCKNLVRLPSSVGGLKSLKDLNLSGCSKLDKLPDELGHVACLEKLDVSGSSIRELPSSIGLLKNLKEFCLAGCKAESPKSWNMIPFQLLRKRSHIPAGLSLPCLSGLHSLTQLNLSDCNLSEEAMPSDFGCLSSLRSLNLSRNQFSRLPESIGQLSRLDRLRLEWCHKIRRLPELPSHVWVDADNCISLDTLANQIGQSNSLLEGYFVNCFKLVENQSCESIALSLLTRYLMGQALSDHKIFEFVVPGNEIPEWYNHRTVGSSITVELHPGWFSKKWMGFACCVVFRLLKPLPPSVRWLIKCELSANGKFLPSLDHIWFGGEWGQPVLDHIWFFCGARDMFSQYEWQDIYYQLVFLFQPNSWDDDRIKNGEIVQVKKCGVRMVYEEDAEELSETLDRKARAMLRVFL